MPHSQCLYISQYAQFSIHRKPIIVYVYPSQFSFFLVISLVCSCTHNLSFNLPSAMSILLSTHITCPFPCLFAPLPIPCHLLCHAAHVFIPRKHIIVYVYPAQSLFPCEITYYSHIYNLLFIVSDCHTIYSCQLI